MAPDRMVSVVIPTYNEAGGIEQLIAALSTEFEQARVSAEVVVVDDNSPDGTGAIVESLAQRYPVRCIHRAGKLGLSSAVIDGWARCSAPIIGVMDADFSHDPSIIPRMLELLTSGQCELAIGSRYVAGGGITNWPWRRRITSRVAIMLAAPLTRIKDITSGYFFCQRSVIEGVTLDPIGFKIGLEVIMKGNYRNAQEVPYVFTDRRHGSSKLNSGEIVNYLRQLAKIYSGAGRRPRTRATSIPSL
ncbi:MAG: hypothetical protein DLM53_08880 [Candidatus Eremiobacter antarcticus]|nr:polyprenol monophosphomannose synthase [Candidatus Eremiobacteraeota bacterium]PZR61335.1 MAG: hypothetical protein DLM53_08880 [Candidatus Eremiobacter sp. RRmetagenome_bin22]